MANKRKAEYLSTRVRATEDGQFEVVGTVDDETEEVISTHPTVDEAIAARP